MKIGQFGKKTHIVILTLIFLVASAYSFILANKRYENYEYGKFDLGNMSQMVWNTAHGNFMEVTDQFGTNMPRWGMSHIDPIIAIFAPIYWVYADPMVLVLGQQLIILSAIEDISPLTPISTNTTFALACRPKTFTPAPPRAIFLAISTVTSCG